MIITAEFPADERPELVGGVTKTIRERAEDTVRFLNGNAKALELPFTFKVHQEKYRADDGFTIGVGWEQMP